MSTNYVQTNNKSCPFLQPTTHLMLTCPASTLGNCSLRGLCIVHIQIRTHILVWDISTQTLAEFSS